ncbi:MAG: MerR family transcriptional regulator [Proteobacteria bacterium]|nr:MerR family transcriptional regulator [Pseudomonadota bacterium]
MKTYRITELGRRFGLSRSTLLYYDRIGLLHPSGRTQSDYRVYTEENLKRLERICFFREAGLSLEEIARLLASDSNESSILEKRLCEIGEEMAALKSQQRLITGILKTVTDEVDASGLDKDLWLSLQRACGLDESALKSWHLEFERQAPEAHHSFLLSLGLSEKEAIQIRMLTKNMENNTIGMKYFYEVFVDLPRQGPGTNESTLKALGFLSDLPAQPKVLDIGCGSGMPTMILAEELKTNILAIDNHKPMLERLDKNAKKKGLSIETRELSMMNLPFDTNSFDLLWSEGAMFIIGLARGLKEFFAYLKPGGYLVFTEMCLLKKNSPVELQTFFNNVYPDIKTADAVKSLVKENDYKLVSHFKLPDQAWWNDYYTPMLDRIKELKTKNAGVREAEAVYENCLAEIDMHRRYSDYYGYIFFITQKRD